MNAMTSLRLEHQMRDHIRAAIARLEAFDAEIGEDNVNWNVSYNHNDGNGIWSVHAYRYSTGASTAAQLMVAVDNAISMAKLTRKSRELPSLLTHEQTDED